MLHFKGAGRYGLLVVVEVKFVLLETFFEHSGAGSTVIDAGRNFVRLFPFEDKIGASVARGTANAPRAPGVAVRERLRNKPVRRADRLVPGAIFRRRANVRKKSEIRIAKRTLARRQTADESKRSNQRQKYAQ